MVSFTHSEFFAIIILGPIIAAFILAALFLTKRIVSQVIDSIVNRMEYKRRFKEIVEMKERGETHEWITMAINLREEAHVCKKTGYCPKVNGFFNVKFVQNIAKEREKAEEYNKYRNRKIADIALKYNVDFDMFNTMIDEVITIPRDYHVMKLDQLQKELKPESNQ